MESRGNRNLVQNGVNIGTEQIGSTLHFGPYPDLNGYPTAHYTRNAAPGNGFNNGFHRYQMEWTPDRITFKVDDVETGTVSANSGFWNRGGFANNAPGVQNPWRYGEIMAPFDQEVCFIRSLLGVSILSFKSFNCAVLHYHEQCRWWCGIFPR